MTRTRTTLTFLHREGRGFSTRNIQRGNVVQLDGRQGVFHVLKREYNVHRRTDDLVVKPFDGTPLKARKRAGVEPGERIVNGVTKITAVAVSR